MALQDESLLHTFQKHVEDMRNLTICKICIKPFYEPYVLRCGHTYCYSCLASWFSGPHNKNKVANCPDCRAEVTSQPAPNYLLRDLVHMFIGRVELLPEDETIEEHQKGREDEAKELAADRAGSGLFKGRFRRKRMSTLAHLLGDHRGIQDFEDHVTRCPRCTWELEDGLCNHCGWGDDSSSSDDSSYESQSNLMSPQSPPDWSVGDNLNADIDILLGEVPDQHGEYYDRDDDSVNSPLSATYDDSEAEAEMDSFIDDEEEDEDLPDELDEDNQHHSGVSRQPPNPGFRFYGITNDETSSSSNSDSDATEAGTQATTFDDDGDDDDDDTNGNASSVSEQGTNYDHSDDDSVQEVPTPAVFRNARRRRVIDSDDEEEDDQEQEEDQGEEEEEEEESDDTAIRPPQSAAQRRNRLSTMRARRSNNHSHPYRRPSPPAALPSRNQSGGSGRGQTTPSAYQQVRRGRGSLVATRVF